MTARQERGGVPRWHEGVLVGFDLETTGVDPLEARIVTAAIAFHGPDGAVDPARSRTWLVDPGVPIPAAAAEVHGITTEYAREHGVPAASAIPEIIQVLTAVVAAGLPIVVFNASYDLTLLMAAARRHGLDRPAVIGTAAPGWPQAAVIDPLVIDRAVDRYRRGKRTLAAMAAHYGIGDFDAHSAQGDAVAACLVARRIAAKYPAVGDATLEVLHHQQVGWSIAWADNFQEYLRSSGRTDAVIDGTWPVRLATSM